MYIAIVLLAVMAPVPRSDNKAELKAMEGKWVVVRAELEGTDAMDTFKSVELVIDRGHYVATVVGAGVESDEGTFTVGESRNQKTLDVVGTAGNNRGNTYLCLYELKDDVLTICYGLDRKTRPAEVKSAEKSNTLLIVYKRKK